MRGTVRIHGWGVLTSNGLEEGLPGLEHCNLALHFPYFAQLLGHIVSAVTSDHALIVLLVVLATIYGFVDAREGRR